MFDLTIAENCSTECYDFVISSLLKYMGFKYEAYNLKYLYFDYLNSMPAEPILGLKRGNDAFSMLQLLFNIKARYFMREELIDLKEKIETELKYRPLAFIMNSYYCPWSPYRSKLCFPHMFFVVGIKKTGKLICFDVHYEEMGYAEIDFEFLENHFEGAFIFDFANASNPDNDYLLSSLSQGLLAFNAEEQLQKNLALYDYFLHSEKELLFPDNLETSIPLKYLLWISEDKKNFHSFLRLVESESLLPSTYELFSAASKNFLILRGYLMKYAITGILKEDLVKKTINNISETDKKIWTRLSKIVS
ncbi:MAG: hypothetical protein FWG91_11690 [Lachnospiraceae bacterium]|nr:hypothetical protein [Lachnospiraceae bacterium]